MTVNELEQALRNLIASQPMLNSGPNGEVINSMLMIVYSYREFMFKVQNHPSQDTLKYNMMNEVQKLENDLVISVCQVMQERGINIMLYAPQNQYNTGMGGSYGRPSSMQSSMGYSAPMGMNYGQMNMYPQNQSQQMYAQPMPSAQMDYGYAQTQAPVQQQTYAQSQPQPQRKAATNPYPKTAAPAPTPRTTVAKPKPVASIPKKPKPEPQIEQNIQQEPQAPTQSKQEVVAAITESYEEQPTTKAAGRDYLLELLKK